MSDPESLFQIDARILAVLEANTDHETGEVDEAAFDQLDALYAKREGKLLAYAHVIKWKRHHAERLKAQAQVFEAEGKALRERARRHENLAERLLARAEGSMSPGEVYEDDTAAFAWRKSTRALVDGGARVSEWPEQFRKTTHAPRLDALKKCDEKDLPEGVVIDSRKRLNVR